jgi:anti-anti-sigma factor
MQLVEWIEQEVSDNVAKVVIDLRKVHHIDRAALNILMQGERHCRAKNANLVFCSPQLPVRMMFALTQYDSRFRIYDDIVTAFNALFH